MKRLLPLMIWPLLMGTLLLGSCGSDNPTATGPTFTVEAPTLLSPAEGQSFDIFPRDTTLTWEAVPQVGEYRIEVDTCLGTCAQRIVSTRRFTTTEPTVNFTFGGMNPGRWRVMAVARWGTEGNWSEWRNFRYLR